MNGYSKYESNFSEELIINKYINFFEKNKKTMCGIAGLSLKKVIHYFLKDLKKFLVISHRGPDSNGIYKKNNVQLIHTRLSIVDINGGSQPIKNEDLVLVANGEVYNDLTIRSKIKKI